MRAESLHRYEELAGFVTALVENGTLRPGARAPSLREISRQRRGEPLDRAPGLSPARGPRRAGGAAAIRLLCRGGRRRRPRDAGDVEAAATRRQRRHLRHRPEAARPCRRFPPCAAGLRHSEGRASGGGKARPLPGTRGTGEGGRVQRLHRGQGRSAAAPGDRPPRPALGPGAGARGHRHHLRLQRGADPCLEGGVAARRYDRGGIADLFRRCCRSSRRSASRRWSCRPTRPAASISRPWRKS